MTTETTFDDELDNDLWEPGDECPEGGDHMLKRRYDDEGGWYELCAECGETTDTSDGSHL